ncbi:FxsA family protein [Lysinibacillus sp. SGAir0095]|uniref:FxsA family protein n=1 Tax=Lysinibacillus sp. SGAir0095 TaxID=2070463 RepID=UPI0010CCD99A|nr:FxsA family protein [Lysinibacillus sp. SGAir0095]QCR33243.1 exlusion protein FxsA [Lysinibacillus sp. SGAir0095]
MRKVLGVFIAAILVEIAMFIVVGKALGVFNTLLLIILTSVIGVIVAKKQGIQSVRNLQNSVSEGNPPGVAIIDTFLIFVGGVLLVTPGFLTDLIGFSLIIPFTRKLYKPVIYYWLRKKLKNGQAFIIHR